MKRLLLLVSLVLIVPMSGLAQTNLSADVPMSGLDQTNLDSLLSQVEAATGKSREWLLQALVDAESQYDQISRIRDADCKNYSGRVKWHGKRLSRVEDLERLLIIETYEDGYVYEEPFKKVEPMSVEERCDGRIHVLGLAAVCSVSLGCNGDIPALLRDPNAIDALVQPDDAHAVWREVERQRIENEKTTNEVTVVYGD